MLLSYVNCRKILSRSRFVTGKIRYECVIRLVPIKLLPQCVSDRVRYKDGDPHPYCVDGCSSETTCGETIVPSDHLDVSCLTPESCGCVGIFIALFSGLWGYTNHSHELIDLNFYISSLGMQRSAHWRKA